MLNATRPSPFWYATQSFGFGSPHTFPLHSSVSAFSSDVNCTTFSRTVTYPSGEYPSLEAMVCSLVLRGDDWSGPPEPPPVEAAVPPQAAKPTAASSFVTRDDVEVGSRSTSSASARLGKNHCESAAVVGAGLIGWALLAAVAL